MVLFQSVMKSLRMCSQSTGRGFTGQSDKSWKNWCNSTYNFRNELIKQSTISILEGALLSDFFGYCLLSQDSQHGNQYPDTCGPLGVNHEMPGRFFSTVCHFILRLIPFLLTMNIIQIFLFFSGQSKSNDKVDGRTEMQVFNMHSQIYLSQSEKKCYQVFLKCFLIILITLCIIRQNE